MPKRSVYGYIQGMSNAYEPTPVLTVHGMRAKLYEVEFIVRQEYTKEQMMNIFQTDHALPIYIRIFTMGSSFDEIQKIVEGLFTREQFEMRLIALRLMEGNNNINKI
jgi:hypothetical protein